MDIQEQAISKKQQMMDFCVGKTLEILKESIETRAEHLSDDKMDEVEQKEYDRAMEELTQTINWKRKDFHLSKWWRWFWL